MRRLDVLFRALRTEKNPGANTTSVRRGPGQPPKQSAKQQLKKKLAKPGATAALVKPKAAKGEGKAKAKPKAKAKAKPKASAATQSEGNAAAEAEVNGKKHLYNIRATLRKFRSLATKELPDDVRLVKTKEYLTAIGNHIAAEAPLAAERMPRGRFELCASPASPSL